MKEKTMAAIKDDYGFVPNIFKVMSESPAAPLVYTKTEAILAEGLLSARDQQVVQLVISVFNECDYCISFHSKFGEASGVSHEDILALRRGETPQDESVAHLQWVTREILTKRGHLSDADLAKVKEMGLSDGQLYEVVAHIGRKMITNYASHIIKPEIDEQFFFEE